MAKLAPFKEPFWKPHTLPSPCMLLASAVLHDHPCLKGTEKCMLHQIKFEIKFTVCEKGEEKEQWRGSQQALPQTSKDDHSYAHLFLQSIKTEAFYRASLLVFSSQTIMVNTYF